MAPYEEATQPPTQKASCPGGGVRNPGKIANLLYVEVPHICQIFGQPKDVEKPRGIGQEFRPNQRPHLAITEKAQPRDAAPLRNTISGRSKRLLYMIQLFRRDEFLFTRQIVKQPPRESPQQAEGSGDKEYPSPIKSQDDKGNQWGCNDRANARTGVEDAEGKCPILRWKPLGYSFCGTRKAASLAEAKEKTRGSQTKHSTHEPVQYGGQRPPYNQDEIAPPSAEPIRNLASTGVHCGVGQQEQHL